MFDINTLMDCTSEAVSERGENMYYNGNVGDVRFRPYIDFAVEAEAWVRSAHLSKRYLAKLVISKRNDAIVDWSCDCPFYQDGRNMCKHCVALGMKVLMDIRTLPSLEEAEPIEVEPASVREVPTSPRLSRFLLDSTHLYQNNDPEEDGRGANLYPFLTTDPRGSQGLLLELRIGKYNKLTYFIKNIQTFLMDMDLCNTTTYGKQLTLKHIPENFESSSLPLLQFLRSASTKTCISDRTICLQGALLDQFMDTLQYLPAHLVSWNYDKWSKSIPMPARTEEPVDLNIQFEAAAQGGYNLSCASFTMCIGAQKLYIQKKNEPLLHCIPHPVKDNTMLFLRYLADLQGGTEHLCDQDAQVFIENILPCVYADFPIHTTGLSLEQYMPEVCSFRLYLDLVHNKDVTCTPYVLYRGIEFPLLKPHAHPSIRINKDQERRMKTTLDGAFNDIDETKGCYVLQNDDQMLYDLITHELGYFKRKAEIFYSDSFKKLQYIRKPKVSSGVSVSNGLLSLRFESNELTQNELNEVLSAYTPKKRFYRLKNGTILETTPDIDKMHQLKTDLQLDNQDIKNGSAEIPLFRSLYLNSMAGNGFDLDFDDGFSALVNKMKEIEEKDYEVPSDIQAELKNYQIDGYRWLRALQENGFAGLLADEMGLGKTLQTIAFLDGKTTTGTSLIVCPASLVYNWESEFHKFAPHIPVQVIAGNASLRTEKLSNNKSNVLITSYDTLKRDIDQYADMDFDVEVIDEAQAIKNPGTQAAKAVKQIKSRFRIALTGTPIENRLSELWSIFDYLMPGYLYPYNHFRNEIEEPIVLMNDEEARNRLQQLTGPFILRRQKKDVLKDLPEKIERVMYCELTGEQKKLYIAKAQELRSELQNTNDADFRKERIQILAGLTRLRQVCCDPALIYNDYKGNSEKTDLCLELIRNAIEGGHKILLFSQFTSMLDVLIDRLQNNGIRYHLLTGATDKQKRMEMVDSFSHDDVPLFCISLRAGGTGLNLTAADMVIHYDPWWNTAVENQASDRAHRIGQQNNVTVYRLIMKQTIEEKILELQERKADLAQDILNNEAVHSASLSKEDLLNILE